MRTVFCLGLAISALYLISCRDDRRVAEQDSETSDSASKQTQVANKHPGRSTRHDAHETASNHRDHTPTATGIHDATRHEKQGSTDHAQQAGDHGHRQHDEHTAGQDHGKGHHSAHHDRPHAHKSPRDHTPGHAGVDHGHADTQHHDKAHTRLRDSHHHDRPQTDRPAPVDLTLNVEANESGSLPADQIFNRRILPIMRSEKKSSCTECHFTGVDLQDYIHEDQATTFAALRDEGLIDVKAPDKSKLLTFIARRPEKENELLAPVRRNEYQAFRTWIRAAVNDPELLKTKATKESVGSELPVEVIRHARKDRVLSSFVDNVWSQIGRCINCHSPERNQRLLKKHGEEVSWIVPRDPAATLQKLVDGGNIDTIDPELSPVLLKPSGLEKHGGGPKFFVGGHTYKQYLTFLRDYAAVVNSEYKTAKELPPPSAEVVRLGGQHLRIVNVPDELKLKPLRVDIYRWSPQQRKWSDERWATAYNPVPPKAPRWQSMISVTAPADSPRAKDVRRNPLLPAGAYLAKVYVDRDGDIKDPDYQMGKGTLVGQVEITGAWRPGYKPPKIINFPAAE